MAKQTPYYGVPWAYTLTVQNMPSAKITLGKTIDVIVPQPDEYVVVDLTQANEVLQKFMLKGKNDEQSQ